MKDVAKSGWAKKLLASFAKTGAGGTPKKTNKAFYEGGDIPWLLSGEVANANIMEAKNFITAEGLKGSSAKLFPPNSVLVAMYGATAGEVGILRFEAATNQAVCAVLPSDQHIPEYLYYYLLHAKPSLAAQAVGNAQPNISQAKIKSLLIPLPPLEEQQRIVAVLDEAFEGLARARSHAEANLQNARELFDSYAKSVFQPHEASENQSESTTVGAVCDIQSGAGFPLKYQGRTSGEYPFYKVSDMNLPGNEWELQEANNYISEDVRLELRARLFPEYSIVFPKVGGAIATNKKRVMRVAGCVDNNVMGLIPDESKVVSEYIHEWLRAFDIYEFSNKANPPSITQGTVSGWPLRVPSRDAQQQVVETAAVLREQTESLRKSYEARLQNLDDLRQSLLQKAFAGELT